MKHWIMFLFLELALCHCYHILKVAFKCASHLYNLLVRAIFIPGAHNESVLRRGRISAHMYLRVPTDQP